MPYGLKENVITKVNRIFAKYPAIAKAILYGSRAKGNYRKGSDIDITLVGDAINLKMVHKLENELDDLLLPYTFDISLFKNIKNQALLNHIERVGQEFYLKKVTDS